MRLRLRPDLLTLGIETSCDDCSAAVTAGGTKVRSSVVSSQDDLHCQYGGVVPELASRRHTEAILPVIEEALLRAETALDRIDLVAVTVGPGLVGSLLVGLMAAKGLAWARGIPLVGVHHLMGHIHANFLENPELDWPAVCLIVSGGHSDLVFLPEPTQPRLLGGTRDDAAGEAYDKVARLMGLGYPGGPHIDRLAASGRPDAVEFPRPMYDDPSYDFSFSGLKTAVALYLEDLETKWRGEVSPAELADVAASFQRAAADVLVAKTIRAARELGVRQILLAGGVAANSELRRQAAQEAGRLGIRLHVPPARYCTDNAAMIAAAGYAQWQAYGSDGLDLDVSASLELAPAKRCGA